MSKLYLSGNDIKALTTAVVMASLGWQVAWRIDKLELKGLIRQYAFEHQLVALWQLYRHDGHIRIIDEFDVRQVGVLWLFTSENPQADTHIIEQLPMSSHLIISGSAPLGVYGTLAQVASTPFVFYIPFVFLKDGASFSSMLSPHLFLVGEKTKNTAQSFELLSPIVKHAANFATANIKNTELARSGIMTMLAARLSFINELSRLADRCGGDIMAVKHMMGLDARIGSTYLSPSWGFGGYTLPTELTLLQDSFAAYDIDTALIKAIGDINEVQKELLFRKFWQHFDTFIGGKTVLIWGAGYKAGSGRTLNSAIHPLLSLLWSYDVTTYVYDKQAEAELLELYSDPEKRLMVHDAYEKLSDVDALFVLNWPDVTPLSMTKLTQTNIPIFDAQNLLTDVQITQLAGFYTGIGRGLHTSKGQT